MSLFWKQHSPKYFETKLNEKTAVGFEKAQNFIALALKQIWNKGEFLSSNLSNIMA